MPGDNHRVPVRQRAFVLLLPILLFAAAPAGAERVRVELKVSATVAASCLVSTAPQLRAAAADASPGSSSCTDGARAAISVERRDAEAEPLSAAAFWPAAASAAAAVPDPVPPLTLITISY